MLSGRLPVPAQGAWLRRSPALNSGKLTLSRDPPGPGTAAAAAPMAVPRVALNEKDNTSGTCVDHTSTHFYKQMIASSTCIKKGISDKPAVNVEDNL